MYSYEDEEQKKLAQLGAPLSGIQYKPVEAAPAPLQERKQPGVAQQLGTTYLSGKAIQGIDKGVNYTGDKISNAIDTMKTPAPLSGEAPMGEVAQTGLMEPTAADVASFNAPLSSAPSLEPMVMTPTAAPDAAVTNMASQVSNTASVGAPAGATAAGADAAASGLSASTAGPLAGVVEFARTGDVKKGVGAGAGAAAGAVAGNALLPGVGGYLGSMVGAQLGSAVGGK